jgi:hypothetical protein
MKNKSFSWGVEGDNVFQSLKISFTTAPFLSHANLSKPFVLEINVSNFAVGTMLLKLEEDNLFHHVDFHFRKFFLRKINYEIHDKKTFNHHRCL